MNCKDVRENLMDVLAQEQAAPEVLAHLRQCSACTAEVEGLRKTMALLDEWEAPEPSPYFLTRLKAHAREEQEKAPARAGLLAWLRKPALAGSLAAMLLASGVLYKIAVAPPFHDPGAVADVEALDKDHDLLTNKNNDLINEMAGLPSDDATDDEEI
jgi:anti-sigma factor RsiW